MGRKSLINKEVKIKACKDNIAGRGSYASIAKSVGVGRSTFRSWYYSYQEHKERVFKLPKKPLLLFRI